MYKVSEVWEFDTPGTASYVARCDPPNVWTDAECGAIRRAATVTALIEQSFLS